ncbi:hypothetical protein H6501_05270 [Candidatus Woesearchaeota archaeon]|nr:hypothetical protein [Candidatus Woesearchaeota archaeon]USN44085.1 MAG: hypothetical protein H6500_06885 [Candidatus Woesearchaeota archaeon]
MKHTFQNKSFKNILLLFLLFIFLFFLSCSASQNTQSSSQSSANEHTPDPDLQKVAQDFLEEQKQEKETVKSEQAQEQTTEIEESTTGQIQDSIEENESMDEEEEKTIDLKIKSLEIEVPSNFELFEDEIEINMEISSQGLTKEDEYEIEVLIINEDGNQKASCHILVDGNDDDASCSIDSLKSLGTYKAEAYLDSEEKYTETNEGNNFAQEYFTLHE